MSTIHVPQPDARRVLSIVWFPFFFVAVMASLFSAAFSAPSARDVPIAVVGIEPATVTLETALADATGSYRLARVETWGQARTQVATGKSAAAVECSDAPGSSCRVAVASAAGSARATTVRTDMQGALASLGSTSEVVDVAPAAAGDRSGSGLFFYSLPLAMTGMVTSIVLLQLAMWPTSRKIATIAAVGAFASGVDYLVATAHEVLPADPALLPWGFALVQAIAWTTTAAATWLRQFFVPAVLTFVLLLGVPSSGGTVTADMLPAGLAVLHHVLPLGAFIDVVRASAYGVGGLAAPAAVLLGWVAAGAGLMMLAHRHRRRATAVPQRTAPPTADRGSHTLLGTVTSLSGAPVPGATLTVLDESGREVERGTSTRDGSYTIRDISTGRHHLVVTATHCEPVVLTLVLAPDRETTHRDVRLEDWQDPASNLTAQPMG